MDSDTPLKQTCSIEGCNYPSGNCKAIRDVIARGRKKVYETDIWRINRDQSVYVHRTEGFSLVDRGAYQDCLKMKQGAERE